MGLNKILKNEANDYSNKDDLHIILGAEILSIFPTHHVIYQFEQLVAKNNWTEKGLLDKSVLDNYYKQLGKRLKYGITPVTTLNF